MFGLCSFLSKAASIAPNITCQQTRNTFVLKRRWQVPLHKKGGRPTKLRGRHFVYDLVQDTNLTRKPDVTVVLKEFVQGVGSFGDLVTMRPMQAYRDLLMPGLAVYATPENLLKYKVEENKPKTEDLYSSPYVQRIIGNLVFERNGLERIDWRQLLESDKMIELLIPWDLINIMASRMAIDSPVNTETLELLRKHVLSITMSKTEPWTLEPWHVKASFRKSGFYVPEDTIEMPPVQITGPDLSLQEKEFYVTVTINNKEKVNVRCRIHHWATGLDRVPWELAHWKKPREALIAEQAAVLQDMPLHQ